MNIGDVCQWLDDFAPKSLAADWDNTGLLLGSRSDPCRKILCCLTVTQDVVEEAIDGDYSLIVYLLFSNTPSIGTAMPYMMD